jgi:predicted CopG family antitoxin
MRSRHTITVNNDTYQKLKRKGIFNESFSELISRLVDIAESTSQSKSTIFEGGMDDNE